MTRTLASLALAILVGTTPIGYAMAQTTPTPEQTASLTWMQGARVHTNPNGTELREAFIGPINGVVTGMALGPIGTDKAFAEYHRIGPNAEGVYGLDVANTRNGLKWGFTPLKSIEPGKITFQSADGSVTISFASAPGDRINARFDRVADGKTTTLEWHYTPVK